MRPQPPIQSQSFGRTFALAALILGTIAVFQLGGVTIAFFKNIGAAEEDSSGDGAGKPPLSIDVAKLIAEVPPPDDPGALGIDPLSQASEDRFQGPRLSPIDPEKPPRAAVDAPPLSSGAPQRPTPVPLSAFTPKVDPQFNELIEQGKLLRNTGDTAGALVKFRAAGSLDPRNPLAIAEQAFTFEKMSLPDKAAEQWRRIIGMGDAAGVYFSAAKSKLDSAVQATVRETPGGHLPASDGEQMVLGKVQVSEDPDPAFAKKLTLKVPIVSRAGDSLAIREMKVYVLFYERANGKDIVRTNANVSNRWGSPPADWKDGDSETLEVSYELPQPPPNGERREYHGYIVRLYYRGELQDAQADPASLQQKFPPPTSLSN
ncbi:MAG: hypothetical protein ABMA01_16435 [Chthoniobacteraceae bacterium]